MTLLMTLMETIQMTPLSNHAMSLRIAQVPNSLVARAQNGLIAEESATATRKMCAQARINARRKTTLILSLKMPAIMTSQRTTEVPTNALWIMSATEIVHAQLITGARVNLTAMITMMRKTTMMTMYHHVDLPQNFTITLTAPAHQV